VFFKVEARHTRRESVRLHGLTKDEIEKNKA